MECLVLEFHYLGYSFSKNEALRVVPIQAGIVDFKEGVLTRIEHHISEVRVRRTKDNVRERPNGYKRHDPFKEEQGARRSS